MARLSGPHCGGGGGELVYRSLGGRGGEGGDAIAAARLYERRPEVFLLLMQKIVILILLGHLGVVEVDDRSCTHQSLRFGSELRLRLLELFFFISPNAGLTLQRK